MMTKCMEKLKNGSLQICQPKTVCSQIANSNVGQQMANRWPKVLANHMVKLSPQSVTFWQGECKSVLAVVDFIPLMILFLHFTLSVNCK